MRGAEDETPLADLVITTEEKEKKIPLQSVIGVKYGRSIPQRQQMFQTPAL